MNIYLIRYVYDTGWDDGDECVSGGSYDKWKTVYITATSSKAATAAIKTMEPNARKFSIRKAGPA